MESDTVEQLELDVDITAEDIGALGVQAFDSEPWYVRYFGGWTAILLLAGPVIFNLLLARTFMSSFIIVLYLLEVPITLAHPFWVRSRIRRQNVQFAKTPGAANFIGPEHLTITHAGIHGSSTNDFTPWTRVRSMASAREANMDSRFRASRRTVVAYAVVPSVVFLFAITPSVVEHRFAAAYIAAAVILLPVAAGLGVATAHLVYGEMRRRESRRWVGRTGQHRVWADDEGVRVLANNYVSRLNWSEVRAVTVAGSYCRIETSEFRAIVIPARAFPGWSEFSGFVNSLMSFHVAARVA